MEPFQPVASKSSKSFLTLQNARQAINTVHFLSPTTHLYICLSASRYPFSSCIHSSSLPPPPPNFSTHSFLPLIVHFDILYPRISNMKKCWRKTSKSLLPFYIFLSALSFKTETITVCFGQNKRSPPKSGYRCENSKMFKDTRYNPLCLFVNPSSSNEICWIFHFRTKRTQSGMFFQRE